MKNRNKISAVLLIVVLGIVTSGCEKQKEWQQSNGAVWNTLYNITYQADRDLSDSIQAVFRRVEDSLSPFNQASLISRINRNETAETDTLLRYVFGVSSDVCRKSGGRFDPTVSPIVNLWKFGYTGKVDPNATWEPTVDQIDSAMQYVGIRDCAINSDGTIRKKSPGTTFNFSAITKGYACDLVADMLMRNGAENVMVEIGGEVAVRGESPRGGKWRLQLDAPKVDDGVPEHEALEVIEVSDCGVATSGNYRNYHQSSRGRVGHTIDPVSGYPCVTALLSATVIAPTCGEADAYATAAMASPSVAFADSILRCAGVKAILVTASPDSTFHIHQIP
jgi:thiamine biosynthesis lipoprotein